MEEPISLSDSEDFSLPDTSLNQTSKDNQDYLIMTIELGDGQQQHIKIHATDDPNQLAHDFIQAHTLNPELEQSLASLIKQNLGLLDKRSQPSPFMKSSISHCQSMTREGQNCKVFDSTSTMKHAPQINRRSLLIASKQSRSGDIHDRLYRLAKKKKPKTESQPMQSVSDKSTTSSLYFNPGETLYIKGMAMKHSRLRLAEEKLKEKEAKELQELTFRPSINLSQSRYDEKAEDVLLKKAKEYEAHKNVLREKYARDEARECSFRPNIKKNKEENLKVHEDLYQDAQKRQEKQVELANMRLFPFEPNKERMRIGKNNAESREEFIDRLVNSKKKLHDEMEKLRALQTTDNDPATGQKFFSPVTLQNHEASTRRKDKDIWEYLYSMKDSKKEMIKKCLEEEEVSWEEAANKTKLGNQSQKVFDRFRLKQYKKMFEILDSDQDGKISADHIELNGISEKHLEILSPLLEHMLNSGDCIEFSEFAMHIEELRNHLDMKTRACLLERDRKIEIQEIDPHPKLSANTIEIAKQLKYDESMYDRQLKGKIISQLKFEKIKQQRDEEVLKDCSFKPTLITNGRYT
ncbi:hypothetical protein SteCoe_17787 [Stentor coeruleus]|uniref:EF-hand domain-containing protein n=1 Tax=Stentor coeruleus TaxID=5963 RepID=A0A1R2BXZ5_9CILI|nr:hypothetical protein SteCoe_17787 [Stentor coeruleus]